MPDITRGPNGVARIAPVGSAGPPGRDGVDGTDGADGLPGVNAVANDTATASYISTPSSATATALSASNARRSVTDTARSTRDRAYRTWDSQVASSAVAPHAHVFGHSVVAQGFPLDTLVKTYRPDAVVTFDGYSGNTTGDLNTAAVGNFATGHGAGTVGCLVIIGMLNDYLYNNTISSTTTASNLTAIIAKFRAHASAAPNMSVVIVAEWLRSDVDVPGDPTRKWERYVEAAQAVADADPYTTVLDLNARIGPVAGSPLGLFADGAHLTTKGRGLLAAHVGKDLMRAATPPSSGGGSYPTHTALPATMPPRLSGYVSGQFDTTGPANNWPYYQVSDGGYYEPGGGHRFVEYTFLGAAGTYSLALLTLKGTDGGKMSLTVDGVTLGTLVDTYQASLAVGYDVVAGVAISTSGEHTIRVEASNTKNASAVAYAFRLGGVFITRTA